MLLAIPAPALATPGFTGNFAPSTWLVVNTYNQVDPIPPSPSTLTGITNTSDSTLCQGVIGGGTAGPNAVACIESFAANSGSLTLLSSFPNEAGGGAQDTTTTTKFTLANSNPSDSEYRRVYVITFNWSFSGPETLDEQGDPTGEFENPSAEQFVSIRVLGGTVSTVGVENFEFIGVAGQQYINESATVYLPMGAALDFTISTGNTNLSPLSALRLTGFDYVEVPAPLPISGATMVFAASRRLRGRLRKARGAPASLGPSAVAGGHASGRFACATARTAAIQNYSARLGLPAPGLQPPGLQSPRPLRLASPPSSTATAGRAPQQQR